MAIKNCAACDDLRQDAPNFAINGLGTTEINSLKNNTGLNPSNRNKDCKDLNNMNDCLLDNMNAEINKFSDCNWKPFMKNLLPNIVTMFRAVIASMCGIWTKVERQECLTNVLFNGIDFRVDEEPTEGGSYVVAGKGISFLWPQDEPGTADASLNYIGGALVYGSASLLWFYDDFEDRDSCVNFDNGSVERTSKSRKGNRAVWSDPSAIPGNGELLLEFRINRKEYPQISNFFNGFGQETGGGHYQVRALRFNAGTYAYGNHGGCDKDGVGDEGCDNGHLVPPDYTYVQVRLTTLITPILRKPTDDDKPEEGRKVSPAWLMGVRINQDGAGC